VIASYLSACVHARSLTYRILEGADHGLSEERWRSAYTTLLVSWLNVNRQRIVDHGQSSARHRITPLNCTGNRQRPRDQVSVSRSTTCRASASPRAHSGRRSASDARCRSPVAGTNPYASSPPETTDSAA